MALLFSESYLSCPNCKGYELELQERLLIEETKEVYYVNKKKAFICVKCNNVVKMLDKFNEKPMVEV